MTFNPILINGMGTVGSRAARLLLSCDVPVHGVKWSACRGERRTDEILQLYKEFGAFPLIVAEGDKKAERTAQFNSVGFIVNDGPRYASYDVIIDGTSGDTTIKNAALYTNNAFLIQGGSAFDLLKNDYMSVPNAVGQTYQNFRRGARHPSCNTTFCSTALGIVLKHVQSDEISRVDVLFQRRCRDPGEQKEMRSEPEFKDSHHAEDVMHVLPNLAGKIFSHANVNNWEHFHRTSMTIKFTKYVAVEEVKRLFKQYVRCILVEKDIAVSHDQEHVRAGIQRLLDVSATLNIIDADCLLPIYAITQSSPTTIEISGYTPQRSIVGLSVVDWVWGATGKHTDWQDAFEHTNRKVKWHGYSLAELKKEYEDALNLIVHAAL